jgi:hypothetical protein
MSEPEIKSETFFRIRVDGSYPYPIWRGKTKGSWVKDERKARRWSRKSDLTNHFRNDRMADDWIIEEVTLHYIEDISDQRFYDWKWEREEKERQEEEERKRSAAAKERRERYETYLKLKKEFEE